MNIRPSFSNNSTKRKHPFVVNLISALALLCTFCSSGSAKKVTYIQDLDSGAVKQSSANIIKAKPNDKLSIVISSKDPQLALLFNKPIVVHRLGQTVEASAYQSHDASSYTVDQNGDIEFAVIGKIHIGGLSKEEIEAKIKDELTSNSLVNDALVTVEWINHYATILGEVKTPGRYNLDGNNTNIFEVLGLAGDLTIYGKRENVKLLRTNPDNGEVTTYKVNLCNGDEVINSPAYNILPNDVIYVEPNGYRARQRTVNGNAVRSTSFWISLASLLVSVGILISR